MICQYRILKRHDCMGPLLSSFIYGLLTRLPWLCKTQNSWSISAAAFLPPAAILGMIQSAGVDMSRPFSAPGSFSDSGFPPPRLSSNPGQVIRPGLFTSTGNEHRVVVSTHRMHDIDYAIQRAFVTKPNQPSRSR